MCDDTLCWAQHTVHVECIAFYPHETTLLSRRNMHKRIHKLKVLEIAIHLLANDLNDTANNFDVVILGEKNKSKV